MLFNSYVFIFLFLPITLSGFFILRRATPLRVALAWLVACSVFYYGWWNPAYVMLLLLSVFFNYAIGLVLSARSRGARGKLILTLGVTANLTLLGYYKYANFFVNTVNTVAGTAYHMDRIVLPLAISFFTFQQVAYLVDAYRGLTREHGFIDYALFVTFFPQLIAGPIVHHGEMLPQFSAERADRFHVSDFAIGVTIFILGLFKKVVLADSLATFATPIFSQALAGHSPTLAEAWIAALCYSFQLYFDFSGYSDMAIGIGRMFGIRLPLNFNSPYKAVNIIDFWRRWHMTLSRFLRDYLYIPLGGNRLGSVRRYWNLMATMLLGGLWHGAGWTFVFWGGLHGLYLVINSGWQVMRRRRGHDLKRSTRLGRIAGRALTFLVVVVGWVFFRAESFDTASRMLGSMFGLNGIDLGSSISRLQALAWVTSMIIVVWMGPNTQQFMARYRPALDYGRRYEMDDRSQLSKRWLSWRPNVGWAMFVTVLAVCSLLCFTRVSEFIYFQF